MKISTAGISAIKRYEALRLFAYLDSAGVPTIGYGHTAGVQMSDHISEAQADEFLRSDLSWVEAAINNAVRVPISQGQYDAMCALVFNIGEGAFKASTLLQKLNAGDVAGAGDEFLRWDKARVNGELQVLPGLVARRMAERTMFLSGTAPEPVEAPASAPASAPAPRPDQEPYTQPEPPMVAPAVAIAATFAWELAKTAIKAFTPLAQEKLTKEIARHTDKPEIAEQVATAIIQTAQTVTGIADPMEAVVAARKSADAVQKMEASALVKLDELMPMLERMHSWETSSWAAEEASRTAASSRAAASPNGDQDQFLTRSVVAMAIGLMVGVGILIGILSYLKAADSILGQLLGLFTTAGGILIGAYKSRMDHRYGSSRGSDTKSVLMAEMSRRQA